MIVTTRKVFSLISIILVAVIAISVFIGVASVNADSGHLHSDIDSYAVEGDPNRFKVVDFTSGGKHQGVTFSGQYFGTTEDTKLPFTVVIYNELLTTKTPLVKEVAQKIHNAIDYLDGIANTQYTTSDVYRFNKAKQGDTITISHETADMINTAREMYELTSGAYNPAVYRLVDLWGFSSRTYYANGNLPYDRQWGDDGNGNYGYPTPEQKYIDAFIELCDFDKVVLNYNKATDTYTLTKNCPPVTVDGEDYEQWIDLGGIAKGFAVDEVRAILADYGIEHYFINSASSSMSMSSGPNDEAYNLGMLDPEYYMLEKTYVKVSVKDSNLSTSGQYVRKYTYKGTSYSHIIDGKTGYPASTDISTVTLIGGSSAQNDCLTTALTVLGKDHMIQFMNTKYVWENNLKIVAIYDKQSQWDKKKPIITNYKQEDFLEINEDFYIATKLTPTTDSNLLEQGIEYIVSYEQQNINNIALIVVLSLGGVVVCAIIVYYYITNRHKVPKFNVVAVKQDKPFKFIDSLLYLALIVLIVVLFWVFVFNRQVTPIKTVKITSMITGESLFTYDTKTNEYFVANVQDFDIKVTEDNEKIVIVITQNMGKNERSNEITITKGNEISVKMTNSVCGLHQECVKNFPAITSADGVIVCSPNSIRVATTDQADYILI